MKTDVQLRQEAVPARVGRLWQCPANSLIHNGDADLSRQLRSALHRNPEVPQGRVTVSLKDAWVTLEGELDWQFQIDAATRTAQSLACVRGLSNNIRISAGP